MHPLLSCGVTFLFALLVCCSYAQTNNARYTLSRDCSTCTSIDCTSLQQIMETTHQKYTCREETEGNYNLVDVSEITDSSSVVIPPGSMLNTRKGEILNCMCRTESQRKHVSRAADSFVPIAPNATWSGSVTVDLVSVPAGNVLTIQPGTVVSFKNASSQLLVNGWILALGTAESPIIFTNSGGNGTYSGIYIDTARVKSVFQHCIFQYAAKGIFLNFNAQGVDVVSSTFQYNLNGIVAENGYQGINNINDSLFHDNSVFGAQMAYHAYSQISGCVFTNNAIGLQLYVVWVSDKELSMISNCTFQNNTGAGLSIASSYGNVQNCTIINNGQDGLSLYNYFSMTFTNYYANGKTQFPYSGGADGTFNLTYNYWGTTNNTYLSQIFAGYYKNPLNAILLWTPYFSSSLPCSDCLVTTPPQIPDNYIAANTTWSPQNSPYIFMQDIIITPGYTLTILPGTVARFAPGTYLNIDGALYCAGTADQPILFTSLNSTATWGGISIRNTQLTSSPFDSIIVEYATAGLYVASAGVAQVRNSIFRNNVVGYFAKNSVTFNSSTFYGNLEAIHMEFYTINVWNCNVSYNLVGIRAIYGITLTIYNSTVNYNSHYAFNGQISRITAFLNEMQGNRPGLVYAEGVGNMLNFSFNNLQNNFAPPHRPFTFAPYTLGNLNTNVTFDLRNNYFGLQDANCGSDLFFVNSSLVHVFVNPLLTDNYKSVCTFNSLTTPMANFTCGSTIQLPVTGQQYDTCGVCGGNTNCSTCLNQDNNPYTCLGGSCASSPLECMTIPFAFTLTPSDYCLTQCWDGSCQNIYHYCPPVPRCDLDVPKRCPTGVCVRANESCPQNTLKCPFTLSSCPDGSCAIRCGPYNGCPVATPVMCPDGTCQMSMDMCTSSLCNGASGNGTTLYPCWDGQCLSSCPLPPWYDQPTGIDRVSFSSATRVLPTTYNNTLNVTFTATTTYTVVMLPVADSTIRTTNWNGTNASPHLFSTAINITETTGKALTGSITLVFANVVTRNNIIYCLANLVGSTWTCQVKVSVTGEGKVTANTNAFGTYAIVEGYNFPSPTTSTGASSASGTTNGKSAAGSLSANVNTFLFAFMMCLISSVFTFVL